MNKYKVRVCEILARTVIVDADDEHQAVSKVEDLYEEGQIVLGYDDFSDVEFKERGVPNEVDEGLFDHFN